MNRDTANRLADDLESLLTGSLSELEVRRKYAAADAASGVPKEIWANLEHYLADADVRERDFRYRGFQAVEMKKLVGLLRTGASDSELKKISFLSTSR